MNGLGKNFLPWLIIFLAMIVLFNMFQGSNPQGSYSEVAYSDFLSAVETQNIQSVTIEGKEIYGKYNDGQMFSTYAPEDADLIKTLRNHNVRIDAKPIERSMHPLLAILINWFPMLLLIGVWIFFMRQMNSGGGRAMGFGRSKARLMDENKEPVTFKDVAGIDECKQEVEEIIHYLRAPQKFQRLGGKIPKGVLLVGPPGTGKTLLARAIAGEASVPFFTISGSDFVEMFVGVGASRVRDMFDQGRKNAPCLIFIDEIDAVGRHRGAGLGGGNDEREQTLNQLLVEMDGFEGHEGVIIVAATNRPDVLDPALLRPGRFDRQITVPNPDVKGRAEILAVHSRKVPLHSNVDLHVIARGTPGFSGADLANLINEAALMAARKNRRKVTMDDIEMAKDKILMGPEKRAMVMTDKDRELTAYHEAGHALVALNVPEHDPLHKVTIIPRGRALGVTMSLPETDKYGYSKIEIEGKLAMMYGGRLAEEIIYGEDQVTTGAADDIRQATNLAKKMVTEWGMSKAIAPRRYADNQEEVFLGHSVAKNQNISEEMAKKIDNEITKILNKAHDEAKGILTKKIKDLHSLAKALLEYETLNRDEIELVLKGKKIDRSDSSSDNKKDGEKKKASTAMPKFSRKKPNPTAPQES